MILDSKTKAWNMLGTIKGLLYLSMCEARQIRKYKRKYTKEFLIYFISFFSTNENERQTT